MRGAGDGTETALRRGLVTVWAYLRANELAITLFHTKDDIVDACCTARDFFANDPKAIASIT
jgi:hypothetical protein